MFEPVSQMRRTWVLLCVLFMTALMLGASSLSLISPPSTIRNETPQEARISSYSTHAPISINGNSGFMGRNESTGITTGSGVQNDPFVIRDWEIGATGVNAGISIANSDVFFKIYNCHITSANMAGMVLNGVSNGLAIANNCSGNNAGIRLNDSANNTLLDNVCMSITGHGISLSGSIGNLLSDNHIIGNTQSGILLATSDQNVIRNNVISNNHIGISIDHSDANSITRNICSNNTAWCIHIDDPHSSNNMMWENVFYHNNGAGDTFDPSHVQAFDSKPSNWWNTSGSPYGSGNYWSDWTTPDVLPPFGIVDSPYKGPGLGGIRDCYPLTSMQQLTDAVLPSIEILSPTVDPTYSTNLPAVDLGGTASDNTAVACVTWTNARTGASGTASGSTDWSVDLIQLNVGMNEITVVAHDAAGNQRADSISVNRIIPPTVNVLDQSGITYLDGDLAQGANYLYALGSQYRSSGCVAIVRSTDGTIWDSPRAVLSGISYPHGGFCVYTVAGTDYVLVSSLGFVRRSVDNGDTFTSLPVIGTSLDYTAIATNASMDPSRPVDNDIYVAGNIEKSETGLSLFKSHDNGASWSLESSITSTWSNGPVLIRNGTTLFCLYKLNQGSAYNVYAKESADWGKTWTSATLVYTKTRNSACPGHAQYIDDQKCLLTIADLSPPPYSNSRGVYGYFWYSNLTFQQIGYETGIAYNNPDSHTYSGLVSETPYGTNYTSLWCYYVDASNSEMRVHFSYDSSPLIAITSPTADPLYTTREPTIDISGTASDNVFVDRITWINPATGASGTAAGTNSWAVSDIALVMGDNTITVTALDSVGNTATDVIQVIRSSWSDSVNVFDTSGMTYLDGDLAKGANYLYAIADEYRDPGTLYLKRSADGSIWSSPVTVLTGLDHPHGGFCVYSVDGTDNIIVSSLGYVRKSTDNGATFTALSSLPSSLDYNTVATNASMDPSRPYDSILYAAGNLKEQYTGIFLSKSVNGGVTWSPLSVISNTPSSFFPVLMRDSSKLYCMYGINYGDTYVRTSSDWGKTWSAPTKIYTKTQGGAIPCHAQYLDNQRCLLTIQDVLGTTYNTNRGVYGYFWYSNLTFQQIGYETGPTYNSWDPHTYAGIAFEDSLGTNYTSLWCYAVDSSNTEMRTHYTHEIQMITASGFKDAPVITNYPTTTTATVFKSYFFNASATASDNGPSSWVLMTNMPGLSVAWSDSTRCLVKGTCNVVGTYWARLTVADLNSSDYINWTIQVDLDRSSSVKVFSTGGVTYLDGDIAKGANYLYAIADEYSNPGSVYVKRSVSGSIWSSPVTVFSGLDHPHAGFCVYTVGGTDHIIATSLGYVKKSIDNGATFSSLSSLSDSLDYTNVATNSSMDPSRPYDNNIYVAGNIKWDYSGIRLSKSVDGGATWSPLSVISNTPSSFFPVLVRDSSKLYCIYGINYGDTYVRSSSDWGATWSTPTKIYTKTQLGAIPGHAQYIDNQRCLLTIEDVFGPTYSCSRGVYGYFWYSNLTFQQIGYETGPTYNSWDPHTYAGIAVTDSLGTNYTSLWCYAIDNSITEMRTHYSHSTGIQVGPVGRAVHRSIYINGNSNFAICAMVNGWSGDGSDDNPYIISNYDITSTSNNGIQISNTNVHFTISNVAVHSTSHAYKGIYLNNVDNARIEDCVCSDNYYGIYLAGCSWIELCKCNASSSSGNGIYVASCDNILLEDCDAFSNGNHGVHLSSCQYVNISGCIVSHNSWHGIYARLCGNLMVYGCEVKSNLMYGIYLSGCTSATVNGGGGIGTASYNSRSGIMVASCNIVQITGVKAVGNGWYGVHNVGSTNVVVVGCVLTGNGSGPTYP